MGGPVYITRTLLRTRKEPLKYLSTAVVHNFLWIPVDKWTSAGTTLQIWSG